MKKKWWIITGLGIVVLAVSVYWLYFSKPTSFPEKKELISKINHTLLDAHAVQIQDAIYIDDDHVYVPFITKGKEYGKSFWIWQKHKWRITSVMTGGQPILWKVVENDPSTYHMVWNIDPMDNVEAMNLYLKKERGYQGFRDANFYEPGVQMVKRVPLPTKLYGTMKIPNEWISYINSVINIEKSKPYAAENFHLEQNLSFGWNNTNPYDEDTFPRRSTYGGGMNGEEIMFVGYLDDHDLE
jgi:hypothetical protein